LTSVIYWTCFAFLMSNLICYSSVRMCVNVTLLDLIIYNGHKKTVVETVSLLWVAYTTS
jgi:hypothetical protein